MFIIFYVEGNIKKYVAYKHVYNMLIPVNHYIYIYTYYGTSVVRIIKNFLYSQTENFKNNNIIILFFHYISNRKILDMYNIINIYYIIL